MFDECFVDFTIMLAVICSTISENIYNENTVVNKKNTTNRKVGHLRSAIII